MFRSLRFRLALIYIGLATIPLILATSIVAWRSYASLTQQNLALQHQIAASVETEIRAFIEQRESELVLLDQVGGLGMLEADEQRALLSSLLLHQRIYQEVALLDQQGVEQIRLSRTAVIGEQDLVSRAGSEEFLVPMTTWETYFGPVRFDQDVREPLVTISVPLFDQRSGTPATVLVADLRFKTIWDLLANLTLPLAGDVYVVDQTGRVVAHRNPGVVLGETVVDISDTEGPTEGLSDTGVFIALEALQYGNQELVVVAEQPVSEALRPATSNLGIAMSVTSVALLLAVALIIISARWIVQPIEELAASAGAIGRGDPFPQARIVSRDEVGQLALAFNQMASDLEDYRQRVQRHAQELEAKNEQLERDVAARKRAEEKLEQYRDHLEELVRERTNDLEEAQKELIRQERLSALGEMAATVAHEIRNPLGTIRTSVFTVGDAIARAEMDQVERALQLAERNVIRCDNIITQLLNFTRVLRLDPRSVPIDDWLNELLDEQEMPESIVCVRDLEAGIEVVVDSEHLRRAFINVISNAIDALQDESAYSNQLVVSSRVADGRLEILVSDTGSGIPQDLLDKVFEPLFSTKTFGVGLGLPIVKNIMEQHGGGVEIESRQDSGTTVTLWLPLGEEYG